uniref:Uncharacterized protein n=1 Tax=Siphoviridae sp. ctnPP24 TaxID=2825662 RepID=A0A8S5TZ10_9CAUD|nr:MAG TPA: hypothetical protein [Siphoviridae sp. ctnPP24]
MPYFLTFLLVKYIISNYSTICQVIFYNKIGREVPLTLRLNRAYETP